MPYTSILRRAFDILRNEPALWVLGIILVFFGGGGSGRGGANANMGQWETDAPPVPSGDMPAWFNPETLVTLAVIGGCVILLLAVLSLVVRSVALAGLIEGAARSDTGEDVRWDQLLRAGWSQKGRRILLLKLVLALPLLVVLFLVLAIAAGVVGGVAGLANMSGSPEGPMFALILGAIPLIFCTVILLALGGWVLELVGNYAARAIVLDGQPVGTALRRGWRLFRSNIADTLVFSIMLGAIGIVVGLLIGIVFVVVALLVGVPLFLLLASQEFPLVLTLVLALPALLLVILLSAALSGPLAAYFETAWTLVWKHLTGSTSEPGELAPEPVG